MQRTLVVLLVLATFVAPPSPVTGVAEAQCQKTVSLGPCGDIGASEEGQWCGTPGQGGEWCPVAVYYANTLWQCAGAASGREDCLYASVQCMQWQEVWSCQVSPEPPGNIVCTLASQTSWSTSWSDIADGDACPGGPAVDFEGEVQRAIVENQ